ncbi:hypothetical protein MHH60_26340 [Paenibacillus sp. FSL H7-0716]|uniref:Uncharacterized protein n=1 Tax=Paenibacillus odorifer TaxID=189426 RepID=A0AB36J3Y2_9BACL|nr:hypothetical protein [Paenibacillus odorifer]OME10548.1 hypothetical protein BSK47_30560 [Paenibacillus odorifer]
MENEVLKNLERYIGNLVGRTFIKSVAIENGVVNIFYYSNYEDYKTNNENPLISEKDYDEYFTQGTIDKILVGEPVRILREFPFVNNVYLALPFNATLFNIDISREQLNAFLGYEIEKLSVIDDSWRIKFADVYIYNRKNRDSYLKKFVRKHDIQA